MTEWKECKLGDVVFFSNGKSRPDTSGYIPIYGGNGILEYTDQSNNDGETIIIGRVGAYCGSVYYENRPVWVSDNALAAKPKEQYYAKYLYYLLKFSDLNQYAEGSSHPLLTQSLLNSIDIVFCDNIDEQKAIAEVLSSLDDKIDLLTRQNKTLEDLAQAYFRKWFIEDASDKWEEIPLGQLFVISSGKGLKKEKFTEHGQYRVLGANGEIGKTNEYLFNERLIYTGRVGTLGNVFIVDREPVWLSDNTLVFRNIKYFFFVYFSLKWANLADYNVGSTQPLIRQSDIKEIRVFMPDKERLDSFENLANSIFAKINSNQKQIQLLQKLRDTLLPKLISGEIRVKM